MHHRFAGFWAHPHGCAGPRGRRHGFAGMGHMRSAFSNETDPGDSMSAKLRAARARLRAALIEKGDASDAEQRRIAEILDRAADEIRGK